jgi:hypothetical protein
MARYPRLTDWAFRHYLRIASPDRVGPAPKPAQAPEPAVEATVA